MKKVVILIVAVLAIIVLGVGIFLWSSNNNNSLDSTSLRLKWVSQAQFAGYYSAKTNGFYETVGLDVQIDPAGPNISPIQTVVSGANEFGIAGAEQIISARANGLPVVGIAVIFRETPQSLISLQTAGINKPEDLEGKTLAIPVGDDENIYRLFVEKYDLDTSKIKEVPIVTGVSQLLSGEVDAKMAYEMSDGVSLKLQGEDVNILRFRDYDIHFYADTLFTTEDMLINNPEKVRKFVTASLRGWQSAIDNPEQAVKDLLEVNPSLNYDQQIGYLETSIPIIIQDGKLGISKKEVWQEMVDGLLKNKVIAQPVDVDQLFTNEFIE